MNRAVVGVFVVLIVLVGGVYFFNSSSSTMMGNVIADNSGNENVKVFSVDSSHLRFYIDGVENPEIRVKEGDKVRIDFKSSEGFHDWKLDEFNAATEKVNPGSSSSVEFVANKKGIFGYYCSVGQHRKNGMKGVFVVE